MVWVMSLYPSHKYCRNCECKDLQMNFATLMEEKIIVGWRLVLDF